MAYYGTLNEANTYFASRLHATAWTSATVADRTKALEQAALMIDDLKYKGAKATVYAITYDADGVALETPPTEAALLAADAAQPMEFPRGRDTSVPTAIKRAQWDTAYALLDGFDPDAALDALGIQSQTYSSVRTTYSDGTASNEYLMYGIPSGTIWRLLLPYLCDSRILKLRRAD